MYQIVLLRNGESTWDTENRFVGWADPGLAEHGVVAAQAAGALLREQGYRFDLAFTSVLRRANQTLNLALDALDALWLPVQHAWRLNARHCGGLQGLDRGAATAEFGDAAMQAWAHASDALPPLLSDGDARLNGNDPRYAALPRVRFPRGESLDATRERVVPYWETVIVPEILAGRRVLVVAHGDTLRALAMHLDSMSGADALALPFPHAQPLVYELDANLRPIRSYHLAGDGGARPLEMPAVVGRAGV